MEVVKRRDYLAKINKIKNNKIVYTYSTRFILPMLGFTVLDFSNNLVNVHILDIDKKHIVLIFENDDDLCHNSVIKCRVNENYITEELHDDEIIVKFEIPSNHISNFNKFIQGKYSEFDNIFKKKLVMLYGNSVIQDGIEVTTYDIIYPRLEKRKALADYFNNPVENIKEVYSIPDMEYEMFKSIL